MHFHLDYAAVSGSPDLTDVQDLTSHVTLSLNAIPAGAVAAPTYYMSNSLDRAALHASVKVYDVTGHLNGSPAGSYVFLETWTVGSSGVAGSNPEGICAVITLQANYGSDVEFAPGARPRARDRGRIYFGPLMPNCFGTSGATNRSTLTSQIRTDLTAWIKAINLYTTGPHSVPYALQVWSRKNATTKPLVETWMDDRPDYQRRRSDQSTVRTVVPLP
jgi:hypothetical protein